MFDSFTDQVVTTAETTIRVRVAGSGPPLLLLHGFPQTHLMWHRVAPGLAEHFTVVVTDLRGYGDSGKPPTTADHGPYSKRAMARDQVEVMQQLGFDRFRLAGHDRGARCAYRLALDHPDAVERLAVLDIVPTIDALERTDLEVANLWWRWFFLAQPAPLPETLIAADPEAFYFGRHHELFSPQALAGYRAAVADPATIHAQCEDYRAMMTLDLDHDRADRGRCRITAPLLTLWGRRSPIDRWFDVEAVWQEWATDVRGHAIDCGHFLPEEAPDRIVSEFLNFFRD
ncbi:alpha/beta hydrolase [Micromonospora arborensis]|uniref:alpha/beta fold hydrolase n=1 Tax=Micromonospora arborensis TaxID=2116518 RepID=UPI00341D3F36